MYQETLFEVAPGFTIEASGSNSRHWVNLVNVARVSQPLTADEVLLLAQRLAVWALAHGAAIGSD